MISSTSFRAFFFFAVHTLATSLISKVPPTAIPRRLSEESRQRWHWCRLVRPGRRTSTPATRSAAAAAAVAVAAATAKPGPGSLNPRGPGTHDAHPRATRDALLPGLPPPVPELAHLLLGALELALAVLSDGLLLEP